MEEGYNHYIRKNSDGIVIHGFTTGFEQPQEGDMLLSGKDGRHFDIKLMTERGQHKYKIVNGAMVERSQLELDAEWEARPPAPKTEIELLKEENAALTVQMIDLYEILIAQGVI